MSQLLAFGVVVNERDEDDWRDLVLDTEEVGVTWVSGDELVGFDDILFIAGGSLHTKNRLAEKYSLTAAHTVSEVYSRLHYGCEDQDRWR